LDPKGLDHSGKLLALAVQEALDSAGAHPRGADRARTGLWVGAQRISPETIDEHDASVEERGLARLSAQAFTRLVLNAGAGACARLFGLQGPGTALNTERGSGLAALVLAAQALSSRDDADVLLAASVDELKKTDDAARFGEGAACLTLGAPLDKLGVNGATPEALPFTPNLSRGVLLAGWGLAGPGRLDEAMARAAEQASLRSTDIPIFSPLADVLPDTPASMPLFRAALAFDAIARGEAERLFVVEPGGDSAACAVLLTAASTGGNAP
jgi:3-oxoacyl-[acyl-carrier-protein] synthase II